MPDRGCGSRKAQGGGDGACARSSSDCVTIARVAVARPSRHAGVAQLVEQLIRNQQVLGSSPSAGSRILKESASFFDCVAGRGHHWQRIGSRRTLEPTSPVCVWPDPSPTHSSHRIGGVILVDFSRQVPKLFPWRKNQYTSPSSSVRSRIPPQRRADKNQERNQAPTRGPQNPDTRLQCRAHRGSRRLTRARRSRGFVSSCSSSRPDM